MVVVDVVYVVRLCFEWNIGLVFVFCSWSGVDDVGVVVVVLYCYWFGVWVGVFLL